MASVVSSSFMQWEFARKHVD